MAGQIQEAPAPCSRREHTHPPAAPLHHQTLTLHPIMCRFGKIDADSETDLAEKFR